MTRWISIILFSRYGLPSIIEGQTGPRLRDRFELPVDRGPLHEMRQSRDIRNEIFIWAYVYSQISSILFCIFEIHKK